MFKANAGAGGKELAYAALRIGRRSTITSTAYIEERPTGNQTEQALLRSMGVQGRSPGLLPLNVSQTTGELGFSNIPFVWPRLSNSFCDDAKNWHLKDFAVTIAEAQSFRWCRLLSLLRLVRLGDHADYLKCQRSEKD